MDDEVTSKQNNLTDREVNIVNNNVIKTPSENVLDDSCEVIESSDTHTDKVTKDNILKMAIIMVIVVVVLFDLLRDNGFNGSVGSNSYSTLNKDESIVTQSLELSSSRIDKIELNNVKRGKIEELSTLEDGYIAPIEFGDGYIKINMLNTMTDAKKIRDKTKEGVYKALEDLGYLEKNEETGEANKEALDSLGIKEYIIICAEYNSADKYGNVLVDVYEYRIDRESLNKINWHNVDTKMVIDLTSSEKIQSKVELNTCGFDQTKYRWK